MAAMVKHRCLMMIFSDLLTDTDSAIQGLRRLRHAGHDVILFHILDEAEETFPFTGSVDLEDPETGQRELFDADGVRAEYREAVAEFRETFRRECQTLGADYVPLHTGMQFDRVLLEYLSRRSARY